MDIRDISILSLNSDNIDPEAIKGDIYSINNIKIHLGKCAKEIFEVLLVNPDTGYNKEELALTTLSQYSPLSSSYDNSLCKLNSLGLIQRHKGIIKLSKYARELI